MSNEDSLERRLSSVMHELNNRTARKIGALDLLHDSFEEEGSPLSEDQQLYFDLLAKQVYDDREFARESLKQLESSKGYQTTIMDLAAPTRKVFESYKPLASSEVDFKLFAPQQAYAKSNKSVYERALSNLLSNAIKYTEHGKIHVAINSKEGITTTSVADTGSGIPKGSLEDVFEYQNEVRKEQKVAEGHGVGLYHTRREVESVGGSIDVESLERVGSIFYLRFDQA